MTGLGSGTRINPSTVAIRRAILHSVNEMDMSADEIPKPRTSIDIEGIRDDFFHVDHDTQ